MNPSSKHNVFYTPSRLLHAISSATHQLVCYTSARLLYTISSSTHHLVSYTPTRLLHISSSSTHHLVFYTPSRLLHANSSATHQLVFYTSTRLLHINSSSTHQPVFCRRLSLQSALRLNHLVVCIEPGQYSILPGSSVCARVSVSLRVSIYNVRNVCLSAYMQGSLFLYQLKPL
jgi:hypothetical protein